MVSGGRAEGKQLHSDLEMEVSGCARNEKKVSWTGGGDKSKAIESKTQRGKVSSLSPHSQ